MTITITMDLNEANLEKLKALLPEGTIAPAKVKNVPDAKPDTQKATPTTQEIPGQLNMFDDATEAQSANTDSEGVPFDVAPKTAPAITKTDVRAVALQISKAGKQKELAAAFAKFGAKKLSDFDAMPDKYPALMKELKTINV